MARSSLSAFVPSKDATLRGLRHLAQRLGLAAVQGHEPADEDEPSTTRSSGSRCLASRGTATASSTAAIRRRRRGRRRRRSTRTTRSSSTASARRSRRTCSSTRTRANPQRFHTLQTTEDERFAILTSPSAARARTATRCTSAICAEAPRRRVRRRSSPTIYRRLVRRRRQRRRQAARADQPRGAELACRARSIRRSPEEAQLDGRAARTPEPLQSAATAGGKLFATYLKDVTTRAYVSRPRRHARERGRAARARRGGRSWRLARRHVRVLHVQLAQRAADDLPLRHRDARRATCSAGRACPATIPKRFETKQVFYASKDGTRVPMFLVHRKGLTLDGNNPTLLYGYGGFNIVAVADVQRRAAGDSRTRRRLRVGEPAWRRRVRRVLAPAGHEAAQAERLRRLHRRGRVADRQQVHVAGERLAIQGGSNGGLLVGAVMNQRPELFRVGIAQVGVMDMLRFQKFTIGWNWIADYGSSDNPEEFKALFAYSPLHNIRPAVQSIRRRSSRRPITTTAWCRRTRSSTPRRCRSSPARRGPSSSGSRRKSGHGPSNLTKQLETDGRRLRLHALQSRRHLNWRLADALSIARTRLAR